MNGRLLLVQLSHLVDRREFRLRGASAPLTKVPCLVSRRVSGRLRTIVYVDGFNLYYGCLKDSAERWLDVGALCERMLSSDSEIVGIEYFTARVKGRPGNPHAGQRQQTYFRALATVPNLTIHYGRFMTRTATRRCVKDRRRRTRVH